MPDQGTMPDAERMRKAFALTCRETCGNQWKALREAMLAVVDTEPVCRVCGCTQNNACGGGCYWVEDDLCSACAGEEVGKDER